MTDDQRGYPNRGWWNEHQVAAYFGVSVSTVRKWRLAGRGPAFRKIGASVRYEPRAIEAYIESLPVGGRRQGGAA